MSASHTKAREVLKKRRMGLYTTEETLDEVKVCVKQLYEPGKEADEVFTLIRNQGVFNVYSKKEFLPQVKEWKKMGCRALADNVLEQEVEGHKVWMFVIQPPKAKLADMGLCPLALALGVMVSGFTYIARSKELADLVVRYLA